MLSDFMHVLNSKRKHSTMNEYFSRHIQFTTIYLQQEQKLNHNNELEQTINISNCVKATEDDVHIYAKFGDLNVYEFL
jgi:hypothetical protein